MEFTTFKFIDDKIMNENKNVSVDEAAAGILKINKQTMSCI